MNRAWAFRVTSDRDIVFVATARNSVFLADRGGEELDVGCGEFGAGSQPVVEVQVRVTATVSGGCAGQRKRRDLVLSLATLVLMLTAVSNVVCSQQKPWAMTSAGHRKYNIGRPNRKNSDPSGINDG
jgi:hypothetical protein